MLFVFAVVEIAGKQYKVSEGDIVFTEKIDAAEGDTVTFEGVLAVGREGEFLIGQPRLAGASVVANVVRQGKGKKIYVLKYKSKKNEKKRVGHRQHYTKLQINGINA